MDRRMMIASLLAAGAYPAHAQSDRWGQAAGYPAGWGSPPSFGHDSQRRVANFSGGLERMVHIRTTRAGTALPWQQRPAADFRYRWGLFNRTPEDYLRDVPATGLLIARKGEILYEKYQFDRTPEMRLTSWSMAKSVTSLLLGIAVDQKLVASMDDTAENYVPELAGTLHGGTTLRNLGNMSSGAEVEHDKDDAKIYPLALSGRTSSVTDTVKGWNFDDRNGDPRQSRQEPRRVRPGSALATGRRGGQRYLADGLPPRRMQLHRFCRAAT